jgi:hypothetical protein
MDYLWNVFLFFLDGPLLLLFPGACFKFFRSILTKDTLPPEPLIWFLALIGIYAVTLPFIYDEGRYLIPLIPLVVVYGVEGISLFLGIALRAPVLRSTAWTLLFVSVLAVWVNGSAQYAGRIQFYDLIHMQIALWINDHALQDAVIATHDIGIIGYHSGRHIVDLAGLVTPEIVPIMHDPQKLAAYLRDENVTYLIVYSRTYRELLKLLEAQVVFSPGADQFRAMGAEPFEIHRAFSKLEKRGEKK